MEILFVSETLIKPELQLAQAEISHYGYSLSFPVPLAKSINCLKTMQINTVIINANEKKMEAYELCREIKEVFRGAIKVFVFLPNSSASEGSKFGLVNAEVEDERSIKGIVGKLPRKKHRDYILEENITSIYSIHGGTGSSFMTVLLAYALSRFGQRSLILESSHDFTVKQMLRLDHSLALLARDLSKEINQSKDDDWFHGFIARSDFMPGMSYLNLFNSLSDKNRFLTRSCDSLAKIAAELEQLNKRINQPQIYDLNFEIFSLQNSLKLIAGELQGDSYSLFDEIIRLGSRQSKNIFFDLSDDIFNPLNKQLLRFSKNIVILFKDLHGVKDQYREQKEYFFQEYNLELVPVLAPLHHHYGKYTKLGHNDWTQILGEVPLIYPYEPEAAARLIYDRQHLHESSPLMVFAKDLLARLKIPLKHKNSFDKREGLLNFLVKNNA
jgi:hypothetical protein